MIDFVAYSVFSSVFETYGWLAVVDNAKWSNRRLREGINDKNSFMIIFPLDDSNQAVFVCLVSDFSACWPEFAMFVIVWRAIW